MLPALEGEEHEDVWIKSVCYMCINCCGIRAHRKDGVIVKIEGDPDNPNNRGKLCAKGLSALIDQYNPNRVAKPLRRTNPVKGIGVDPGWVEISYDEALSEIAGRLRELRGRNPRGLVVSTFDFGSTGFPHYAFLAAFGSPNSWSPMEYFCGRAYHPVAYLTLGSFFTSMDMEHCKYLMLWGTQNGAVVNHLPMKLAQEMAEARARGMKLLVVDPICSYAASRAEEWVPIRPGTDGALALAMLNLLLNELGIYDEEFLKKYTNGPYLVQPDGHYARDPKSKKPLVWDLAGSEAKPYDDSSVGDYALEGAFQVDGNRCSTAFQLLKEHVKKYTPEMASEITTIPPERIRRIAKEWGENARIGSTIEVEGQTFPLRPVAANYYRGISTHVHGFWNGFAIQLLNVVVGAMDVPGGALSVNAVGFDWEPSEGPEGLIVPARQVSPTGPPYPARKASRPDTLTAKELFPIGHSTGVMFYENLMNPDRYKISYEPELWIIHRTSVVTNTANPEQISPAIKKVKFIVHITRMLDEQSEFADIVLPDPGNLERLDAFPDQYLEYLDGGLNSWYYTIRQPVVKPPEGVVDYPDIYLDLARRVGFYEDYLRTLDAFAGWISLFKKKDTLDSSKQFNWAGIVDAWAKAAFGPEKGLQWFKENGIHIARKKNVREAYPRIFIKPRIPIYLEHFIDIGVEVQKVTTEMGIHDWDTSDYVALPDWRQCASYAPKELKYDLFLSSTKLPFHDGVHTMSNPWLFELGQRGAYAYKLLLNAETARKKGIVDGDEIVVESEFGLKSKGRVKVTEAIHPEVLGVTGTLGLWSKRGIGRGVGTHYNTLLPHSLDRIDKLTAALEGCVRVRVYKG